MPKFILINILYAEYYKIEIGSTHNYIFLRAPYRHFWPISALIRISIREKGDIIHTIENAMGAEIHNVNQTLRSVVADLDVSSVLEIPFGAPLFFNESTYLSVSGKVIKKRSAL